MAAVINHCIYQDKSLLYCKIAFFSSQIALLFLREPNGRKSLTRKAKQWTGILVRKQFYSHPMQINE
jgi:hypothetical protein